MLVLEGGEAEMPNNDEVKIPSDTWYWDYRGLFESPLSSFQFTLPEVSERAEMWEPFISWIQWFDKDKIRYQLEYWPDTWDSPDLIRTNSDFASAMLAPGNPTWQLRGEEEDINGVIKSFSDACQIAWYEINEPAILAPPESVEHVETEEFSVEELDLRNIIFSVSTIQNQYAVTDAGANNKFRVLLEEHGLLSLDPMELRERGMDVERVDKTRYKVTIGGEKLLEGSIDGGFFLLKIIQFDVKEYLDHRNMAALSVLPYNESIKFAQSHGLIIFEDSKDPLAYELVACLSGESTLGKVHIEEQEGFRAAITTTAQFFVTTPNRTDEELYDFALAIGPIYKKEFERKVKIKDANKPSGKAFREF
ncbi:MAG: hypothetical protein H0T78_09165 [Longispora sp.]|nr:hypothetical protein [Longispora sp. (in: high G+C Gram-positive bacteria)]